MRILLLNPPIEPSHLEGASCLSAMFCNFLDSRVTRMFSIENLSLGYLASYLRNLDYSVDILDACVLELSLEQTFQTILSSEYDIIGFTGPQAAYHEIEYISNTIREAGYEGLIVYGGGFATLSSKRILQDNGSIDVIIKGDGEIPFAELVSAYDSNQDFATIPNIVFRKGSEIEHGPQTILNLDRDKQPPPARDHIEQALKRTTTLGFYTSSGCGYGKCSFCSPGRISMDYSSCWEPRSANSVIEEIAGVCSTYSPRYISIVDPDFLGRSRSGKERAITILQGIREKGIEAKVIFSCRADEIDLKTAWKLAELGAIQIFVGFESFNDKRLAMFNKGLSNKINIRAINILKESNIYYVPGHIFFDPYVSLDDVLLEARAYEQMDFYSLSKMTKSLYVLPETPIWEKILKDNVVSGSYYNYTYKILDHRVDVLRECLLKLQNKLLPQFHDKYKAEAPYEEGAELTYTVKEKHMESFYELFDAVKRGAGQTDLTKIIEQSGKLIVESLTHKKVVNV